MSSYEAFAIAGAGNIGIFIFEELAKLKKTQRRVTSVIVLTRSHDGNQKIIDLGAQPVTVDYSSPKSLLSALNGIDVVISTLALSAISVEKQLAVAAKASGVKLFVPSEFGLQSVDLGGKKAAQRRFLEEISLPYAIVYTGPFSDTALPFFGFEYEDGKVSIGGSGDKPVSFTARRDIARYLAHVLTTVPPSKVENAVLGIEGERTSFNDLVIEYQARTGKTLYVTYKSRAELEEALKKNPNDFVSTFWLRVDSGEGVVGKADEVNLYYPDWNPAKVLDVLLG